MGNLTRKTSLSKVFSYSLILQKYIGLFLSGLLILSCSGYPVRGDRPRGVYHRVKSGETLSIIARAYHVDLQELAEINNIGNSDRIETDVVIFIPDAHKILDDVLAAAGPAEPPPVKPLAVTPMAKPRSTAETPTARKESLKGETATEAGGRRGKAPADPAAKGPAALDRAADQEAASRRSTEKPESRGRDLSPGKQNEGKPEEVHFDKKRFIWPVKGRVVNKFGTESITADYNGKKVETAKIMNNGIRIAAGAGTAVVAAGDGKVIYSMALEKFGNTIIVEHDDFFKTVYYDLGKRLVETLQTVRKGQPIAYLAEGKTPKGEAVMSFEIRHKNKARNPLFFLP